MLVSIDCMLTVLMFLLFKEYSVLLSIDCMSTVLMSLLFKE